MEIRESTISALPASNCVETSFPKRTGSAETAPVHTCRREAYRSPLVRSPRRRIARRDGQSEGADSGETFSHIDEMVLKTRPEPAHSQHTQQ